MPTKPKSKSADASLKIGRPNLSEGPKDGRSPLVAVRFPPNQLEQIDAEADKAGLGRSAMVRRLVTIGLQFVGKIKAKK